MHSVAFLDLFDPQMKGAEAIGKAGRDRGDGNARALGIDIVTGQRTGDFEPGGSIGNEDVAVRLSAGVVTATRPEVCPTAVTVLW